MSKNLKTIFHHRKQIVEGLINTIIKTDSVEAIAKARFDICRECKEIDRTGEHCMVSGTQPCCKSCGCSLALKTRSLSSGCPEGHWGEVLTEKQEALYNQLKVI